MTFTDLRTDTADSATDEPQQVMFAPIGARRPPGRHCGHHEVVLSVDRWPDHMPFAGFGPRMACTACGIMGADARPNWRKRGS
jgi:hypothetical protein